MSVKEDMPVALAMHGEMLNKSKNMKMPARQIGKICFLGAEGMAGRHRAGDGRRRRGKTRRRRYVAAGEVY